MKTLITVGADGGDWAPPKPVELGLTTNAPSGLGITNVEAVTWQLTGKAVVVAAAIAMGGYGRWARIDIAPLRVVKGQDLTIAAFALTIDVDLPTLSPHEIRSQGLLDGRLRELTP